MRGALEAAVRLDERCRRAEYEYPRLAAPDGTVAVPIGDLRLVLNAAIAMEAREGGDVEQAPSRSDDSAAIAQKD